MDPLLVPVSPGELLDRITILRIKSERIADPLKLVNVRHELALLEQTWRSAPIVGAGIAAEVAALQRVNSELWDIEDRIREHEAQRRFDADFIALARSVYLRNDERAAIKKRINVALNATLVEEKSYQPYA
jgi:hypothetical protein